MKRDIKDIFDSLTDTSTYLKPYSEISPDRIIELTKNKIKEDTEMLPGKKFHITLIAAAVIFALSCTAFAAYRFLTPYEVATEFKNHKLAEALENMEERFNLEPQVSGDYVFEILGIASGKGLSQLTDVDEDKSYVVGMVKRTDGGKRAISGGVMLTPLISGYEPWNVNAFTLGGGRSEFISEDDLVDYFIFECDNIEVFADHTIYMAIYEMSDEFSMAPDNKIFTYNQDGTISFNEGFTKAHALFEIPIDKSKANPEAAKRLMQWNDDPDTGEAADENADETVIIGADSEDLNGVNIKVVE